MCKGDRNPSNFCNHQFTQNWHHWGSDISWFSEWLRSKFPDWHLNNSREHNTMTTVSGYSRAKASLWARVILHSSVYLLLWIASTSALFVLFLALVTMVSSMNNLALKWRIFSCSLMGWCSVCESTWWNFTVLAGPYEEQWPDIQGLSFLVFLVHAPQFGCNCMNVRVCMCVCVYVYQVSCFS